MKSKKSILIVLALMIAACLSVAALAEEPAETPDPEGIITVKTATPSDCHGTLITLTGLPATAPRKGLYIKDCRKVLVK